ncbi:MAG: MFS transporter [Acholeplasmatales bacterium]|jgi:probable glucitol transport protein GutA|nr:MFS transporter [Acholeplasmatales bacterium]
MENELVERNDNSSLVDPKNEKLYEKDKRGFYVKKKERYSYYSHGIGGFIFNTAFGASLISPFFTDNGFEPWMVTIILIITKVWDAVNDPLGGIVIERSKFKSGKYIPWLKLGVFALPVLLIMFFALQPNWPTPIKVVYIVAFYVLVEGVFTFTDIPLFGLTLSCTNIVEERTYIFSRSGFFSGIGLLLAFLIFQLLHEVLHWDYIYLGIIFAGLYFVFSVWLPFNGKERFLPNQKEKTKFKDIFQALARNKYLIIYYFALLISFGTSTIQGVVVYLSRYVLKDPSLLTYAMLATIAPIFVVPFFIPYFAKKFDKFRLFIFFNIGTIVTSILAYFIGYTNLTAFFIMTIIRGIFFVGISLMAYGFTADIIEYGHYAKGVRAEGVSYSIQTFSAKLISALQAAIVTVSLQIMNFKTDPNLDWFEIEQPKSVETGVWLLFTLIPCIGAILGVFLFRFYKLRDKDVQIMTKCNHGEIGREEAEVLLKGKYSEAQK